MPQFDFHLPSLGADMESATLTQWLKKPGDYVHRGEAIAVVETQKGLIDIECFENAVVTELMVQPGTHVPVGAVLARLTGEAVTVAVPPAPAAVAAPEPVPTRPPAPKPLPSSRPHISPAARRRAAELGANLETLAARSNAAVLHVQDVERLAAESRAPQAPAIDAKTAMRIAIGQAMARSKREIPHYYLEQSFDMSAAQAWMADYNANRPVAERLIEGVLIVKAVALAAAHSAEFNGYFRGGRFEPSASVHVGTAIAVRGGGLVAPALLDADHKDLKTLMREFSDLVSRVRTGHMRSSEFASATITVTSLGEEGADCLYPIINPPQVAIVGAGRTALRPWEHERAVVVRPVITLTLAADHRVTDGRSGSRFLKRIGELLAAPERL